MVEIVYSTFSHTDDLPLGSSSHCHQRAGWWWTSCADLYYWAYYTVSCYLVILHTVTRGRVGGRNRLSYTTFEVTKAEDSLKYKHHTCLKVQSPDFKPGAVAESVENVSCVGEIVGLNPCRVRPLTYKIDTSQFLARCSALLEQGKDWVAQCQDNVTEWNIRSWC